MVGTQEVNGDTVIRLDGLTLVSSKSQPGHFYAIRDGDLTCECPGFRYRQRCRHLDIAGRFAGPNLCGVCGLSAESLDNAGWCPTCAQQFAGVAA